MAVKVLDCSGSHRDRLRGRPLEAGATFRANPPEKVLNPADSRLEGDPEDETLRKAAG